MKDHQKTKSQLVDELTDLRRQLESSEVQQKRLAEQLEQILDYSPVLLTVAGLDGHFKQVNSAFTRILGYTEEELLSQSAFETIHPDDRAASKAQLEKLAAGESLLNFENRNICKDGTFRWLSWTVVPRPEEGLVYGIGHDITDHKRSESRLRESEERFRAIFEQAAVGVAQIETNTGRFYRVNQAYCDIVGYKQEEMTATTFMKITHPDDLQGDLDNMQKLVAGEIREFSMEKRYFRTDGSIVWVYLTVSPMWSIGEEPNYHIAVVEDITERKRAEEELQEAHDLLERRVEQRTAELATSNLALRKEIAERTKVEETLRHHREMMMNMAEGVALVRAADAVIVYANPQFVRMFEYDSGELVGKQVSILNAPTEAQAPEKLAMEIMASLREHAVWRGELQNITKNGRPFWCHASVSTFESAEHGTVWVSVHEDITRSKKKEELLEASRDLAVALNAETNLQKAANKCLEAAIRFSGMDGAGLYIANDNGGLDLVTHTGLSDAFVDSVAHLGPESPAVQRVMAGDALYLQPEELLAPVSEICIREGVLSIAILPIRHPCRSVTTVAFSPVSIWHRIRWMKCRCGRGSPWRKRPQRSAGLLHASNPRKVSLPKRSS